VEAGTTRPVGRPRSEKARRAILAAALELAGSESAGPLTMEAIARRAGVSKETLYRWWRAKADVILEALAERGEREIPVPDTGSLSEDLHRFMRSTALALDPRTRRALRTLAAQAASDPALAQRVRERFLARRRAALGELLQRAVERGELDTAQARTAVDLIFGSLWYRLIFETGPLGAAWAESVADAIGAMSAL